jgi:CCR4-NOT transcription complex subunit 7/8
MSTKIIQNRKLEKSSPLASEKIREIYADNFVEEINILSTYLEEYRYVSMDTEFPGIVFHSQTTSRESYYKSIKTNVDMLKLIQVGITLANEEGESPAECSTWQFNLQFSLSKETFNAESITMLSNSGINFELLQSRGIKPEIFGEYLFSSGLLLNENLNWISFHGIYDFAYLLKICTCLELPENEKLFLESLELYFPNFYDIKHLIKNLEQFKGSLSRLGYALNVERIGTQHQAGSDSLITSEIYFKLKKDHMEELFEKKTRNILFGIGQGADENTTRLNRNQVHQQNVNVNPKLMQEKYIQQMKFLNMQYNYMKSNQNLVNNYAFPFNNFNNQNLLQNSNSCSGRDSSEESKRNSLNRVENIIED